MDYALSEFSGLVFVEKNAHGTNSSQLNQTLLLSDQARALSRPQLRIDADDVECAHGATVGQLNPDEIFYIQSRGMTQQKAKQLLTYGFAKEVLTDVPDPKIKTMLLEMLQSEASDYAIC
jgi:Fe-S cluster assembly protein SufD